MRRGEALALRWRDVDTDPGTVSIRRSAGMVRIAREGAEVVEGGTKSGKPRVVDLDPADAVLRAHRKAPGALALQLARDDALVFGDIEGNHRNPEHVSRQFKAEVARCGKAIGELPVIRLHDLRHTHATILLTAREPVHVAPQRLGHASAVVTMTVYAHVLPAASGKPPPRSRGCWGGERHMRSATQVPNSITAANYKPLTCTDVVSEGDSPVTYMPVLPGELVLGGSVRGGSPPAAVWRAPLHHAGHPGDLIVVVDADPGVASPWERKDARCFSSSARVASSAKVCCL
jgi:hypothetical protein